MKTVRGDVTLPSGFPVPCALMRKLAGLPAVSRRVVDRTGLAGRFDYDLEWTPSVMPIGLTTPTPTDQSDAGPNLFTALPERLGLKLEPGREALPALVIDSVEQPSPD